MSISASTSFSVYWWVATASLVGASCGICAFLRWAGKARRLQLIYDRGFYHSVLPKMSPFGTVRKLKITPVVDFYAKSTELKTEPAVSYYIEADNTTILMDLGLNRGKDHPSPLLHNLKQLNLNLRKVKYLFFSHHHLDHVGGYQEMKTKQFSVSQGEVFDLQDVKVYAPVALRPSKWNPVRKDVVVVQEPTVIEQGICSMGPITRYLFPGSKIPEQVLAINVEGKGVVLLVGCGHPSVERIVYRAKQLFNEPIYAIVGGLHYPVHGGRFHVGPINIQYVLASSEPPWNGIGERDVRDALDCLAKEGVQRVVLSPHDSSDWALEQFRARFQEKFEMVKVGQEVVI
jgi:7,8-dihydropterin-6-yl-methyl-4-(beta-D-ribofuranosyl)aminobenzene 5'-phosphate synthase